MVVPLASLVLATMLCMHSLVFSQQGDVSTTDMLAVIPLRALPDKDITFKTGSGTFILSRTLLIKAIDVVLDSLNEREQEDIEDSLFTVETTTQLVRIKQDFSGEGRLKLAALTEEDQLRAGWHEGYDGSKEDRAMFLQSFMEVLLNKGEVDFRDKPSGQNTLVKTRNSQTIGGANGCLYTYTHYTFPNGRLVWRELYSHAQLAP